MLTAALLPFAPEKCKAMPLERRRFDRYRFSQGHGMRMIGPGGQWECPCTMVDVSEGGARLRLGAQVPVSERTEFTLVLSKTGNARRQCAVVWQDGDYIGVRFLDQADMPLVSGITSPAA